MPLVLTPGPKLGVHQVLTGVHLVLTGVDMVVTGVHLVLTGVDMVVTGVHLVLTGVDMVVTGVHLVLTGVDMVMTGVHLVLTGVDMVVTGVHLVLTGVDMVVTGVRLVLTRTGLFLTGGTPGPNWGVCGGPDFGVHCWGVPAPNWGGPGLSRRRLFLTGERRCCWRQHRVTSGPCGSELGAHARPDQTRVHLGAQRGPDWGTPGTPGWASLGSIWRPTWS